MRGDSSGLMSRGSTNPRARLGSCRLGAAVLIACLASPAPAADEVKPPVDYFIIPTGTELVTGVYADAHTYFLTRTLRPLNLRCIGSLCVDDEPADIKEALRYAVSRASLIIVTGGLGPTDDDVTRQTLSAFTGIPLQEQPDILADMARRFQVTPDKLRANLRRQTLVPTRGTYLKNGGGSAAGLVFEMERAVIVALPGPPSELQPMVRDALIPYLNRRYGTHVPGCVLMLRFVGVGQSQIDHTFKEHVPLAKDLTVTTQFEMGRVDFEFALADDTPQNRARLTELKRQIREQLGEYIYAEDATTLEQHVLQRSAARGVTLAVAEAGSGGSLASALHGAAEAAPVLTGAYVAPTTEQLRRLLHVPDDQWAAKAERVPRLELLAAAAVAAAKSTGAVVVGDAVADDKGNRSVEVVFQLPGRPVEKARLGLRGRGELSRANVTTQLLDALRRKLPN